MKKIIPWVGERIGGAACVHPHPHPSNLPFSKLKFLKMKIVRTRGWVGMHSTQNNAQRQIYFFSYLLFFPSPEDK